MFFGEFVSGQAVGVFTNVKGLLGSQLGATVFFARRIQPRLEGGFHIIGTRRPTKIRDATIKFLAVNVVCLRQV